MSRVSLPASTTRAVSSPLLLLAGAYLAALPLPLFSTSSEFHMDGESALLDGDISGLIFLLFGWGDVLGGRVTWLVHPLLFAALASALRKSWRLTLVLSLAALAALATAFSYVGLNFRFGPGGSTESVTGVGIGWYLWCILLLATGFHAASRWRSDRSM